MSIRNRTEIVRPLLGSTAAVALACAAAVHASWAAGSTWPRTTSDELADLVVGRRPMPGPVACSVVAAALGTASVATARASTTTRPGGAPRSRAVASVVAAAMLARGIGGVAADVCHLGQQTSEFRRWNRRFYNPLCVSLGVLVAAGRRS